MSKLSTYLAQHYLTPTSTSHPDSDSRPKKRRKKDKQATSSGLVIADDDDLLLSSTNRDGGDDKDDGIPLMYETNTKSAEFRKKKGSTWNTVASGEGEETTNNRDAETSQNKAHDNDDEDATADRILADAATAQSQRRHDLEMEDAPAIVDTSASTKNTNDTEDATPKMSSGIRAGLQTAADTAALIEKEESTRREERRREKHKSRSKTSKTNPNAEGDETPETQTIYRDASGRVINLSTRKLELERAAREKEALKRQEREEALGEVQRRQKADRQQDLEEAKFLTLGRGEDDEEMNEMLRRRERWDDPMAGYIAEKTEDQDRDGGAGAGNQGQTRRKGDLTKVNARTAVSSKTKVYPGPAPPNRYNIPPGHRWDGVDRGNGFEKDWFQARSRSKRNNELSYQWQMDE